MATDTTTQGTDIVYDDHALVKQARDLHSRHNLDAESLNATNLEMADLILEAINSKDTKLKNAVEEALGLTHGAAQSTAMGNLARVAALPVGGGYDPLRELDPRDDDDPFGEREERGADVWRRNLRLWMGKRAKKTNTKPKEQLDWLLSNYSELGEALWRIATDLDEYAKEDKEARKTAKAAQAKADSTLENLIPNVAMVEKATRILSTDGDDGTGARAVIKLSLLLTALQEFMDEATKHGL